MCECRDMSMDVRTPRNMYLSAFYKRSFAYHTVKYRMPTILTQLIDNLVRGKEEIYKKFGERANTDLKKVIGEISKFKYEVQTNKPLQVLTINESDVHFYNEYIKKQETEDGQTTHFNTIWLLTECYMYRRLKEIFALTDILKDFDYFESSKRESYEKAVPLMSHLSQVILEIKEDNKNDPKKQFITMLKINLWGNKCDLSISLGKVDGPGKLHDCNSLEPFIVSDHSEKIWEAISSFEDDAIVDIVLDNCGYEVFTDCWLADYIIEQNLAQKIRFYVKAMPWFISDVMEDDFYWMINQLKQNSDVNLQAIGDRWEEFLTNGTWEIVVNKFWTLPFEFKCMKTVEPELYKKLAEAKLTFFKGDLNYRKLFGEINWDPTTSVEEGLQGFHPSKLAILRTVKADIIVGLAPGVAEQIEQIDGKWMENGDYGLIQFCDKIVKI